MAGDFSKLSDKPTDPDLTRGGTDLTPLQKFASRIKGLLVDPQYDYAASTLRGILTFVETKRYFTEGQERAVDNIAANPTYEGSKGRRSQRWYGG